MAVLNRLMVPIPSLLITGSPILIHKQKVKKLQIQKDRILSQKNERQHKHEQYNSSVNECT
jgi:ferredoxin-fold anticodon binding domain-containing protein